MLSPSDQTRLLKTAREQIESTLENRAPDLPSPTPALAIHSGAFVTLHKRVGARLELRGCIGQIDAAGSLYDTVVSVASSAAFSDYRFTPVSADEWKDIELEISVLSPLRRITDPQEVRPGTHGLYMRNGARSGLLLPQVAADRNWDRETFLNQTCRKAGLPPDAWQNPETEISVFTAQVFDEASQVS